MTTEINTDIAENGNIYSPNQWEVSDHRVKLLIQGEDDRFQENQEKGL